jgi:hypothetical protein
MKNSDQNLLKSADLLPCPFCPQNYCKPELWCDFYGFWRVGHGSCGASSGISKDKQAVIEAWNTRHDNLHRESWKEAFNLGLEKGKAENDAKLEKCKKFIE